MIIACLITAWIFSIGVQFVSLRKLSVEHIPSSSNSS